MNEMLQSVLHEVETLPQAQQERIVRVIKEEIRKAKHDAPASAGRWDHLVERMQREAPMAGKSEAFLRKVREFRDNFDLRGDSGGD
jgi:hypothetical protein